MRFKILFMLLVTFLVLILFSGCSSVTKVAIMTKLESGSLVGISEIDGAKLFLESNGIKNIEIVPYDDGWDPNRIERVYNDIRNDGINIIITSHTSSCALVLQDVISKDDNPVIIFVAGATTDRISNTDDSIYRVIQDVEKEQKSIAEHIGKNNYENILVVKDTSNPGYTEPAIEYFDQYYHGNYSSIDMDVTTFKSSDMEDAMSKYTFDSIYLLIGGYQTNSGVISQLAVKLNQNVDIYYTPWMKTPNILDTAGSSIHQSVMPSHYPIRGVDGKIDNYINSFVDRYDYVPTFISLNVYKIIDIINQNIETGNINPKDMKNNIDQLLTFETELGTVVFNEFGDTDSTLYFINDIKKEFE